MKTAGNKWFRALFLASAYALGVLGIIASGGGGGGSSDSGLEYVGNTDPATIGAKNASRLAANTLGFQSVLSLTSGLTSRSDTTERSSQLSVGLPHLSARLSLKFRNALQSSVNGSFTSRAVQARTQVDETEPCDSGSVSITGTIEDNGTGELTLDFINCREGNVTLDGEVVAQIRAFDFGLLIPTDVTYSFLVLTLTAPGLSVTFDGSILSEITGNDEFLTIDSLVASDNISSDMFMIQNQGSIIFYDDISSPSSYSGFIDKGRIFDSIYGYVDYKTIVPLNFSTLVQSYPDNGQLVLVGLGGADILVRPVSDLDTLLDLDLDGNGLFEFSAYLSWSEVEAEQDLTDTDVDGIHDSWEQANGLDPKNGADATLDFDVDSFTNIQEYVGGSDPNNNGSIPASADLSITTATPAIGMAGNPFEYELTINNPGPSKASNVLVTNTLAAGVIFNHASGMGWNCYAKNRIVYCSRNSLTGMAPLITIMVTLPSGSISNTATVSSVTLDTNLSNNSETIITNVPIFN